MRGNDIYKLYLQCNQRYKLLFQHKGRKDIVRIFKKNLLYNNMVQVTKNSRVFCILIYKFN